MGSILTPAPSPPPSTKGTTTTTTITTTTATDTLKPWIETPLIYSAHMSRNAGCNIYLKLENVQPSGSFKSRGIGNMMLEAVLSTQNSNDNNTTHFLCSSGGNAGLACATTSLSLPNSRATIVVPLSTSPFMVQKLKDVGATVVQTGSSWIEADTYLRDELLSKNEPGVKNVYVPPFDHPAIWRGASSLVDEMVRQMPEDQGVDAVVCNVGGGGLVNGVCEGVYRLFTAAGEKGPKVVALETEGADSLWQSVQAGKLVTLEGITSLATSLGARRVSERTWEWFEQMKGDFVAGVVSDKQAAEACCRFLDEGRVMVELSCGATLAGVYKDEGRWLREQVGKGMTDEEWKGKNVVVIVCGGSNVSWEILKGYKKMFGF
ncbi:tryptophan synthase beta subunit-like PLP-dependent enzyme [Apiosordaria backusii]|uniref:L-serine ammonia-lyase n=1 Tax=Apiosordaria backusii TaxID=314023 RepID=A0AA40BRW6_9PEZI|nr:tryptophan synthase beta subunit-like PLP-dependent enzyme [Apiosordaria backusii]